MFPLITHFSKSFLFSKIFPSYLVVCLLVPSTHEFYSGHRVSIISDTRLTATA